MTQFRYKRASDDQKSHNIATAIACAVLNKVAYQRNFGTQVEQLLPPIILNQALFQIRDDEVVGVVTWGKLSNLHQTILTNGLRPLAPAELQSGEQFWIIDCYAELGDIASLLRELKHNVGITTTINLIRNNKHEVL